MSREIARYVALLRQWAHTWPATASFVLLLWPAITAALIVATGRVW